MISTPWRMYRTYVRAKFHEYVCLYPSHTRGTVIISSLGQITPVHSLQNLLATMATRNPVPSRQFAFFNDSFQQRNIRPSQTSALCFKNSSMYEALPDTIKYH